MPSNETHQDFTKNGFRSLLQTAQSMGYHPIPMRAAFREGDGGPKIILRHDVDLSLEYAVELAELEAALNVSATYFILPFNDLYNPFSPQGRKLVRHIVDLGHEVGLHWDASLYPRSWSEAIGRFRRDAELIGEIAGEKVLSASQHVPIDTPGLDVSGEVEYEGYSSPIVDHYVYVSDSNMAWRGRHPVEIMADRQNIQFLAHPIWWVGEGQSIAERFRCAANKATDKYLERIELAVKYAEDCLSERDRYDRAFEQNRQQYSDLGTGDGDRG